MQIPIKIKNHTLFGELEVPEIVPGATHLFEEPGTLETVVRVSAFWFNQFLYIPKVNI